MADTEFEQFRQSFERLPQHIKATAQTYTLVHDLALDDDTDGSSSSARSDSDEDGRDGGGSRLDAAGGGAGGGEDATWTQDGAAQRERLSRLDDPPRSRYAWAGLTAGSAPDPVVIVDGGLGSDPGSPELAGGLQSGTATSAMTSTGAPAPRERRRRRLPEIPQSAKNAAAAFWGSSCAGCSSCRAGGHTGGHTGDAGPLSLAAELSAAGASMGSMGLPMGMLDPSDVPVFAPGGVTRPLLMLKCIGSPDSPLSVADTLDSGHSTMHSPKSMSPQLQHDSLSPNSGSAPGSAPGSTPGSPTSSSAGGGGRLPLSQLELLEATHRGLYKFVPRHREEMEVEIGDLIYVQKEADDLWCEGVNLRTGRQGCFPSAYAVDLEYTELDPSEPRVRRERFLMHYLGSVETQRHKGTAVLAAAVKKMLDKDGKPRGAQTPCVLEVSDKGMRMSDGGRGKRGKQQQRSPPLDYFYSLKHVSFCAYLPQDQRFLGFITKHPQMQRFACHVFLGQESTRPVAESVGRAFQRFYQKYVETAFPVEDIYID